MLLVHSSVYEKGVLQICTSSAKVGRFGFQVKRQFEPMLIGLV